MKKLLALVLALVMVMSLCVTSNAAFSGEEYDYDEAVEVMAAVGVFQGDENGKFNGKGELTREQAAKLIAYLDLGEKVAEALPAVKAFNDVEADRWSAKYVAYCADAGYLAGVGDGNFDPAGKLTGYAFGKMLLCVLGYDATVEAFTGSNWQISVAKLMESKKIAKSVSGAASATLTREAAAQYCFNALKATMVEYADKGTSIKINGAEIATGASKAEDVKSSEDYALTVNEATFEVEGTDYSKVQLGEKLYDGDLTCEEADDGDDYGRPAHVWKYDDEKVGTYVDDEADYVLVAEDEQNLYDLLKDNKLEKKLTKLEDEDIDEDAAEEYAAGQVVELWVDGKNITSVLTYTYAIDQITDVEKYTDETDAEKYGYTKSYTFEELEPDYDLVVNKLTKSNDDYKAIGEFEEDDFVVYAVNQAGEVVYGSIAKAGSFTGKMTACDDFEITVDGEDYVCSNEDVYADGDYDTTFTFYTDPNGVVIYSEEYKAAESNLKYAYVLDSEISIDAEKLSAAEKASVLVKVVFTDGETGVYNMTVNKATEKYAQKHEMEKNDYYVIIDGDPVVVVDEGELGIEGTWVTYTLSDKTISFKAIAEDSKFAGVTDVTVEKNTKALVEGELWANSTTKFVYMDEDGKIVATYTGYSKFPTEAVDGTALVIYGSSESYAKEVYVVSDEAEAEPEKVDVAMFVSTGKTTADGVVTTFYVAGEKVTYTVDDDDLEDAVAGKLYELEIEDDIVTVTALENDGETLAAGTLDVVGDDYVIVEGEEYDLADKVTVFKVARDGKSMSAAELADLDEEQNVVVVFDSGDVAEIYIYRGADTFETCLD